jgi:hypothetical protein
MIFDLMTCKGKVHAPISQTLNVLCAILSREPTSHIPMSPTFVPTALQQKHQKYSRICNDRVIIQEPSDAFEACT